jgi:nucleotide-binding universal stress UspA family protein
MFKVSRILCPTDFSEASMAALPYAIELASAYKATLFFIHVVPVLPRPAIDVNYHFAVPEYESALHADAESQLSKIVSTWVPKPVRTNKVFAHGSAAEEILRAVEDHHIDLIVIATHGHSGWRHLLFGSVAEKVVRQSKVPVLTIRGPG